MSKEKETGVDRAEGNAFVQRVMNQLIWSESKKALWLCKTLSLSISPLSVFLVTMLMLGFMFPIAFALSRNHDIEHLILYSISQIYLIPAAIAISRGSEQSRNILVLNLLGGWTIVGWLFALRMALKAPATSNLQFWVIDWCARAYVLLLILRIINLYRFLPYWGVVTVDKCDIITCFAVGTLIAAASFQLCKQRLLRPPSSSKLLPLQAAAAVVLTMPTSIIGHFGCFALGLSFTYCTSGGGLVAYVVCPFSSPVFPVVDVVGIVLYLPLIVWLQFCLAKQFVKDPSRDWKVCFAPGMGLIALAFLQATDWIGLAVLPHGTQFVWTAMDCVVRVIHYLYYVGPILFCVLTKEFAVGFFGANYPLAAHDSSGHCEDRTSIYQRLLHGLKELVPQKLATLIRQESGNVHVISPTDPTSPEKRECTTRDCQPGLLPSQTPQATQNIWTTTDCENWSPNIVCEKEENSF